MSDNVALVRSIFAAWERGDFGSAEWAHPEIEYVLPDGPQPGYWSGLGGMAQAMRGWLNAWNDFRAKAEEYRELDDGRVLVLAEFGGRGKTSGLDVGQMRAKGAGLFHIRDARVVRFVGYWNRARALTDLGLSPDHHP